MKWIRPKYVIMTHAYVSPLQRICTIAAMPRLVSATPCVSLFYICLSSLRCLLLCSRTAFAAFAERSHWNAFTEWRHTIAMQTRLETIYFQFFTLVQTTQTHTSHTHTHVATHSCARSDQWFQRMAIVYAEYLIREKQSINKSELILQSDLH